MERRPPSLDEEAVFDPAEAIDAIGFVRLAVRRHRMLAAFVFTTIMALGMLAAVVLPRHYLIATKMLADKNVVMPALIERRAQGSEADAPTRLATEAVLNRENLVGIVRETQLLEAWPRIRSPLGKARDAVRRLIRGKEATEQSRVDALVDLLRGRLSVETSEGTVTIQLDWMDAATGYRVVQAAQQHFFDQRRASEVAMIEESIRILEGHVATAQQAIQDVLATMPRSAGPSAQATAAAVRPPPRARPNASEVAMLTAALQAKVQAISGLETSKNERLSALQSRMAELRNNLGPAHPDILTLQENIKALNADSPRLRDLRAEEAALRARLAALGGPLDAAPTAGVDPTSSVVAGLLRGRSEQNDPPDQLYAKSRLKITTTVYEDLLERLEGARLSLETAGAAFKYRYTIITPPELPRFPTKPNVPILIVGSLLLAVALAVVAALTVDVAAGRILQGWQVRRQLKLPVLAEVRAA